MSWQSTIKTLVITVVGLIAINWLGNQFYQRFDLTQDKRYTLSDAAKEVVSELEAPITVEVFLDGKLPSEFKRLQSETDQLLAEFASFNKNIQYRFINPVEDDDAEAIQQQMIQLGLKGANVEIREGGKVTNETVFPLALAYYGDRAVPIGLLKNSLGATSEERVNNSIQNLEYAFADGFGKLTQPKRRKVAVLKGNAEMDDRYLADFITTLRDYYYNWSVS